MQIIDKAVFQLYIWLNLGFTLLKKNGNLDLATFFQQYASKARSKGEGYFKK